MTPCSFRGIDLTPTAAEGLALGATGLAVGDAAMGAGAEAAAAMSSVLMVAREAAAAPG